MCLFHVMSQNCNWPSALAEAEVNGKNSWQSVVSLEDGLKGLLGVQGSIISLVIKLMGFDAQLYGKVVQKEDVEIGEFKVLDFIASKLHCFSTAKSNIFICGSHYRNAKTQLKTWKVKSIMLFLFCLVAETSVIFWSQNGYQAFLVFTSCWSWLLT